MWGTLRAVVKPHASDWGRAAREALLGRDVERGRSQSDGKGALSGGNGMCKGPGEGPGKWDWWGYGAGCEGRT